jgi:hypothetical protein
MEKVGLSPSSVSTAPPPQPLRGRMEKVGLSSSSGISSMPTTTGWLTSDKLPYRIRASYSSSTADCQTTTEDDSSLASAAGHIGTAFQKFAVVTKELASLAQHTQNKLKGSKVTSLRPGGPSRLAPAQQTYQFLPHRSRRHYEGAWKKWAFHHHQFQPHRGRRHYEGV